MGGRGGPATGHAGRVRCRGPWPPRARSRMPARAAPAWRRRDPLLASAGSSAPGAARPPGSPARARRRVGRAARHPARPPPGRRVAEGQTAPARARCCGLPRACSSQRGARAAGRGRRAAAPGPRRLPRPRARRLGGRAGGREPASAGGADAHPRTYPAASGWRRSRSCSGGPSAAVLLDEPTRGMDRARKEALARRIEDLAGAGACRGRGHPRQRVRGSPSRERVVLLGQGEVIADDTPAGHTRRRAVLLHRGGPRDRRGRHDRRRRSAARARPARGGDGMTWQVAPLALLAVVVAGGIAWYDRSRPPARVLSSSLRSPRWRWLGGSLSPPSRTSSRPPTSLAGYALGAVPGFAVGTVTALVSNVFLSQGPWTVWQMAGWAPSARPVGCSRAPRAREPSRMALACACGVAGLAFGAWMDVYVWTYAARQDPESISPCPRARCPTTSPTRSATSCSAS